jgi:hypothetical protein
MCIFSDQSPSLFHLKIPHYAVVDLVINAIDGVGIQNSNQKSS